MAFHNPAMILLFSSIVFIACRTPDSGDSDVKNAVNNPANPAQAANPPPANIVPSNEEKEREFFINGIFLSCDETSGKKLHVNAKSTYDAGFVNVTHKMDWDGMLFVPVLGRDAIVSGGTEGMLQVQGDKVQFVATDGSTTGSFYYDDKGNPVLSWPTGPNTPPRILSCKPKKIVCEIGEPSTMPYYFITAQVDSQGSSNGLDVSKLTQLNFMPRPLMAHFNVPFTGTVQTNAIALAFDKIQYFGPGGLKIKYNKTKKIHAGSLKDDNETHKLSCSFGLPKFP